MMVRKHFLPWLHHVSLTHKHWTRVVLIRSPGGHLCWTWSVDCCLLCVHLGQLVDNIGQWGSGVSISELYLQCLHSVDIAEDFDDERCQMPFLGPKKTMAVLSFLSRARSQSSIVETRRSQHEWLRRKPYWLSESVPEDCKWSHNCEWTMLSSTFERMQVRDIPR